MNPDIRNMSGYENIESLLGSELGSAVRNKLDYIHALEVQLARSNELVEKLYASGCLDYERESLVRDWISS